MIPLAVKTECLRLRLQERLGLREIAQRQGLAKASVSLLLRGYPLLKDEIRTKTKSAKWKTAMVATRKPRGEPSRLFKVFAEHQQHTSRDKGRIAEAAVFLRLTMLRFNVLKPSFEGDSADWVIQTPQGAFVRLQVKYCGTHGKTGLPSVSLRGSGSKKRYQTNSFEFIVGYDLFTDTAYIWSMQEVAHLKTSVTICEDAAEAWHKIRA